MRILFAALFCEVIVWITRFIGSQIHFVTDESAKVVRSEERGIPYCVLHGREEKQREKERQRRKQISSFGVIFLSMDSEYSSLLSTEVSGRSISAGPRLFCRNCRTISSSSVLVPSPTSSREVWEIAEKKTGDPNPKTANSTNNGSEIKLPNHRWFSDSNLVKVFIYHHSPFLRWQFQFVHKQTYF